MTMNIYSFKNDESDWQLIPLSGPTEILGLDNQGNFLVGPSVDTIFAKLFFYKDQYQKNRCCLLMQSNNNLKINGNIPFTLQVLQNRDELNYNQQKLYFMTEQPAVKVSYEAENQDTSIFCPRCKDKIIANTEVVQCPSCRLWYHESEKEQRNCWSYDDKCICGHSTNSQMSWKPAPILPKTKWRKRKNDW